MKYFLTFDIGTENLAYCLASYNKNGTDIGTKYEIIDCGVTCIDGLKLKCATRVMPTTGRKSKGKICNKKALFYENQQGVSEATPLGANPPIGYCQAHKTDNCIRMSSNVIFSTSFTDKIDRLTTFLNTLLNTILLPINVSNRKIKNLHIHIENQPALLTPVMKTISVAIMSYFRAIQSYSPTIIKSVRFVSPSIKTAQPFIDKLKQTCGLTSKIKTFKIYDNRKYFSEEIIEQFFEKLMETKELNPMNCVSYAKYNLLKKKDDLCDAVLYVLHATI